MKYTIVNEIPGRVRLKLYGPVPKDDVGPLEAVLGECEGVKQARVYPRVGELALSLERGDEARACALACIESIGACEINAARGSRSYSTAAQTRQLLLDISWLAVSYFARRALLPKPFSFVVSIVSFVPYALAGIRSLAKARLDVPVLDAAAIGMSFLQADPKTAGETMFLLRLGETMEEYTEAQSQGALIDALLDVVDTASVMRDGTEVQIDSHELKQGDVIVVRTGMPIPVDGVVESGVAMVNQASLTGEPLAIERTVGDDVFAGTSVENGEVFIRCNASPDESRLRSIIKLVNNAELYQSDRQKQRQRLASRVVPWNFLLAGIVALATRSLTRTSAALMVDYSCGLKLTGSIAELTALSQAARSGFTVKGSRYFDALRNADTIVFDKTGTLTEATPRVAKVLAFDGWNQRNVLRFSACLEEHFPHPVARAVVKAAIEGNLEHRHLHGDVEYIVAHGIASTMGDARAIIGSEHFVVEDEGVEITARQKNRIARELEGLSPLYLAVDGQLVGAIGIEDPLKEGVGHAVEELRELGFKRIVMLTGDNERTAARVAEAAGVSEFRANQLPEDKHEFVMQLKEEGCSVVMVGDGVNDAPALAQADVGIAMGQGTAVAKEVADITLSDGDLASIVKLVKLSRCLSSRMDKSFVQVIGLNSLFMIAGVTGLVTPQTSSLLHNATTIGLSLGSGRSYSV